MGLDEIVALTLFWAEGTKPRKDKRLKDTYIYSTEITNTDPVIIQIFLAYLRDTLKVRDSKIKVQLQVHEGDDIQELERFWENVTKIFKDSFNKTIIRPVGKKIGKSKGVCKIRVHDKDIYAKITLKLEELRGVVHR